MPYGIMGSPEQAARPEWTYSAAGILNWNQRIEKEESRLVAPIIKARPVQTIPTRKVYGWYTERMKTEYPGSIEQDFVSRNFHALQPLLGLSPDKKRPGHATIGSQVGSPVRESTGASRSASKVRSPSDRSDQQARHFYEDSGLKSPHRFRTPGSTLTPRLRGNVEMESAIDLGEYWPFESGIRADGKKEETSMAASKVPKLRLDSANMNASRSNTYASESQRSSRRSQRTHRSSEGGSYRVRELQEQVIQEREKREAAELRLFQTMREMAEDDRSAYSSRPELYPVNVDGSGLQDLQVGKKIKDMFRPPTGDLAVTWREGVPSLGLDNSLWHSTVEALGTTHNANRHRRFLPPRQQY